MLLMVSPWLFLFLPCLSILVILQGKGKQLTYWLTGKSGFDKPLPPQPENEKGLQTD